MVESAGREALGRGMKSIAARVAHAVNRVFHRRRRGSLRPLSPARAAFAARGAPRARVCPAQRSEALAAAVRVGTARWSSTSPRPVPGSTDGSALRPRMSPRRPERLPRRASWLLCKGWRPCGLVDPGEMPGSPRAERIRWQVASKQRSSGPSEERGDTDSLTAGSASTPIFPRSQVHRRPHCGGAEW